MRVVNRLMDIINHYDDYRMIDRRRRIDEENND